MSDNVFEDYVRDQPWAIWDSELGWYPFPADLAAKYASQGCLVRLVASAAELLALPAPAQSPPDPDPDAPPYGPQEIVWYEAAAELMPDAYLNQWQRIARWITDETPVHPQQLAGYWRRKLGLGRWGGGADLSSHYAPAPLLPLFGIHPEGNS
jgi:hypothetical protein